jgi:hypothetical protein
MPWHKTKDGNISSNKKTNNNLFLGDMNSFLPKNAASNPGGSRGILISARL